MEIAFTKMHALGNDFVVIDGTKNFFHLNSSEIARLSHRQTGIGFDQLLLVEKSNSPHVDFQYRIFNANGEEVGQCGNGARCLARFVQHHGLTNKTEIVVKTTTSELTLKLLDDNLVSVNLGIPQFSPRDIPIDEEKEAPLYFIPLENGTKHPVHALSIGNPHAVTIVQNLEKTPVRTLGQEISWHPKFPQQVNAEFMEILTPHAIRLRVFERGVGETLACGSGAVAASIAGILHHGLQSPVSVQFQEGEVSVFWEGLGHPAWLTGEAQFVYEGRFCSITKEGNQK